MSEHLIEADTQSETATYARRNHSRVMLQCNVHLSSLGPFLLYLPLTGNPFRGKDAGNIRWRRRKYRSVLSDGWMYRLGIQILNKREKGYRKPCSDQAETLLRSE
jgi:hypothetical protein